MYRNKLILLLVTSTLITACGMKQITDVSDDNENEKVEVQSEVVEKEVEEENAGQKEEMYAAYREILTNFLESSELLDIGVTEPEIETIKKDSLFAVFDQDGDGYDELAFRYDDGVIAGMQEHVYDYDFEKHTAYLKFSGFYGLDYYENGAIADGISHGNFKAGDFWPYTLYVINKDTNKYEEKGFVDAYCVDFYESEKEFMTEEDAFPFDVDKDGNGYVYYIDKNDGSDEDRETPLDDDEYQAWLTSFTDGTKIIEPDFYHITEEYISNIGKKN
ncbi:hypothetical protein SAMN02910298_02263 [Pseudobutyrivibrio sp. YE44]|nr:hypothetical protein SAMN02910298_02263 [Pseudobutyrivibrio sp. YE44]